MPLPRRSQRFEVEIVAGLPLRDASRCSPRSDPAAAESHRIVALVGESLLSALRRADAPILSVCGGQASCGACRVEVESDWLSRLPSASQTESLLLEFLEDPIPNHRLACQLALTPALNGLRLTLAP
jgi:ferredoxin